LFEDLCGGLAMEFELKEEEDEEDETHTSLPLCIFGQEMKKKQGE